ncbi:lipoprotein insertase outer membrane protein LolB [Pseudomonas sp. N040]|uniref:lipoprotein insertase outer membrane protein LolB n=1 Tax=Pseudomonas sp. N040 TaxID=2785325 RepID=UPI0018A2B639|nr:lipoprotein insertase outer membrane protein LolB [Pseudomonas sp. N040]MBF7730598.1 lipoprotein localization protein LolB [Pseudomonas sp. N040]MBW7014242.1 lipoprotein insertase outer membrane protein LolB [Pseudomonas sp. N040]
MQLRTLLLASTFLLLGGCAGLTSQESIRGQGDPAAWEAHKQQVQHIDGWQINGKIGIRAPRDSGSATLFWLQRQDYFDIRLAGPLAVGSARLSGRSNDVVLDLSAEGRFHSNSAEDLLEKGLGWRLPVSQLFWWVRGLPGPDSQSEVTLDRDSRLNQLQQDGWQIQYLSYIEQDGYTLPERIKLKGHDLQVTLVIKDWQPRQLGR